MVHYAHPEQLARVKWLTKELEARGEQIELMVLCSVLVLHPPGLADAEHASSDPAEVTCPDCHAVIRQSGLFDEDDLTA